MVSPEDINNMHSKWIKTLEENDCTAFELMLFATDVSALSRELELLPLLKYFDKLVMALRMKFRTDLKHLLQTVNESDQLDLLYCYEDVELIAKERNLELLPPVDHDAGKADKSVIGTDSFCTTAQEGSQVGNFGTGSSFSELQSQGTTSTSFDDNFSPTKDVSPLNNVRKRRLEIPSASAAVRSCSDNDLPEASADNGNQATPASVRSRTSTINKAQRIRQRHASSRATEDKLFNSWLESQIDTNAAKKLWLESETSTNAARKLWLESDTNRNNAKVELMELLRRKTLLEIQHLEGQVRK